MGNNNSSNGTEEIIEKNPEEITADLEEKYERPFEVVEKEEGGVTVAGRLVADRYLMESTEDGTRFRYVVQPDGEVDDYYIPMLLGNRYYEETLKPLLDELYGAGNYVCQAMLTPGEELTSAEMIDQYDYNGDDMKDISLYIALPSPSLDQEEEAGKLADVYNSINFETKMLIVGFFTSIPEDIDKFLVYETSGQNDAFSSFYADQMTGELVVSNIIKGDQLEPSEMKDLIITDVKGE